jgi:hypothetical protein
VTANPTAEWIARQITEAFPDEAPRFLIRDRDTSYGAAVTRRLRAMGIRDRPIMSCSPWQNGHVERLIGSIRRECLDHVVVLGERHLRHLLANYATYYNGVRTHLALDKDTPLHRPAQTVGRIASVTWLGGLHRHYVRMAESEGTGLSPRTRRHIPRILSAARVLYQRRAGGFYLGGPQDEQGSPQNVVFLTGTEGSNPSPSSGESCKPSVPRRVVRYGVYDASERPGWRRRSRPALRA